MEYTPFDKTEEDEKDSEKDDSKDIKKSKKTTKIPRYIPMDIEVAADRTVDSPKPRLTISERLFERMNAKDTVADETKEKKDESESKESPLEASTVSDNPGEESGDKAAVATTTPELVSKPSEEAMEATNWESEGELHEEDEIPLNTRPRPQATKPVVPESASDEPIEFVPVPVETTAEEPIIEPELVDADLLEAGLSDEGAEEPPEPPVAHEVVPSDDEDEPDNPVITRYSYIAPPPPAGGPWYNAAAADHSARERAQEISDAEYRGEKQGTRRGALLGLAVGWMFGRHGKKKAAREHVKEIKSKDKEIKTLQSEQFAAKQRIQAIRHNQEQLSTNIQEQTMPRQQEAPKLPERPVIYEQAPTVLTKTVERVREVVESSPLIVEHSRGAASRVIETAGVSVVSSEIRPIVIEKIVSKVEVAPEDQEITEETYQTAAGSRVETSAWHRIEVDEKTGKAVDNPEVAYGEEFKHEQRQEVKKDDPVSRVSMRPAKKAGMLGSLASSSVAPSSSMTSVVRDQHTNQSPSETPSAADSTVQKAQTKSGISRYTSDPIIWIAAAAIVVVLFIIGSLH
jgi:hypothetical protein